ncbi:hypothetical protein Bca52824_060254 [Brassica carinata]|uniref:Uncharacterized protein n=1 Tax=Brassica carinata TaxID=52824 RepID=A0A8X7QVP1_BRACI|nr:hypothetical protein Bca52824_060254 [Brassica carinata]
MVAFPSQKSLEELNQQIPQAPEIQNQTPNQRGCLFKKKRKSVVYVHKLFREPIWIPAKQWKPEKELVPEKGIDERAQEFINRMKARSS